jgi:hypothetical protein
MKLIIFLVPKPRMRVPLDSKTHFQIIMCPKVTAFLFLSNFLLHFPRRSTPFLPELILFYTMATPTLKWPLRIGAPKTTGDTPMSSDNEGPNPNANYTPIFSQSSTISGYYNTSSFFNFTWSMDTPMLPGAMPTIRSRNGLRTRDIKGGP